MAHYLIGLSDKLIIPSAIPPSYISQKLNKKLSSYLKEFGYMKIIEQQENSIIFSGSLFRFIWNGWNLFNPVSNGKFDFHQGHAFVIAEYEIYFWEYLFYSILFSIPALSIPYINNTLRIIYLVTIWSIYVFHTFWVKFRLKKLILHLIDIITQEYFEEIKASEGIG